MNKLKVQRARVELVKLIRRIDALLADAEIYGDSVIEHGSVASGKVRRASMEATRSLADLRKPG